MFQPYWDDFDLITIESNTQNEKFIIWDKDNVINLVLQNIEHKADKFIYHLSPLVDLHFNRQYFVCNQHGEQHILLTRDIVRTEQFDEQFYYDGPLGTEYTTEQTTFRVWAPTSSEVLVKLKTPTRNKTIIEQMTYQKTGCYEITLQGDFDSYSYVYLIHNQGSWKQAVDPYAISSKLNSTESYVINPEKVKFNFTSSDIDELPISDSIIYETHVRDFTSLTKFEFKNRHLFKGLIEEGVTNSYGDPIGIDYLKDLGITHLQLQPIFDFSSINEFDFVNTYNWGYDPEQFNVIEGRYCSAPDDPYNRLLELKTTIEYLRKIDIGIIMDVVYNHVYHHETFSQELIIPGYFFRYNEDRTLSNGTGCGNDIASERRMVRRFIIDSLKYWLQNFRLSGFRFDLLGIFDLETSQKIINELRAINPNVYLYGEGWDLATELPVDQRTSTNNAAKVPELGFFNDRFRDIVKGSTFNTDEKGLIAGNHHFLNSSANVFNGFVGQRFSSPTQSINYISCHDNHTLYDRLKITVPENLLRDSQKLGLALVLLAQGIPFLHSGSEFLRSKNGLDNSYNAPDPINSINWDLITENSDVVNYIKNIISIRKDHKAFRLDTKELLKKHVEIDHDGSLIYYHIKRIGHISRFNNYLCVININDFECFFETKDEWLYLDIEHKNVTGMFNHSKNLAPKEIIILVC